MPRYKNDMHRRRAVSIVTGMNFGVYVDVEFMIMSVPGEADEDYYAEVVSEFYSYCGLDRLNQMLDELGLELEDV